MMKSLPRAPSIFEGMIEDLFERIVEPIMPSIESVERFHALLLKYLGSSDVAYVVRGRSDSRRTELHTTRELRILPSDNSPAWWAHHVCWSGHRFEDGDFPSALEGCPRHFHDISARGANGINAAGWYVAHIMPAKTEPRDVDEWDPWTAAAAMLRNVHPANQFYVPGGRSFGEDRRLIAFAAKWSKRRYGLMWEDLVARSGHAAEAYLERLPAVTGQERISLTSMREKVATITPVVLLGTPSGYGVVEYRKNRLWFMADVIEVLDWNQAFRIITPDGAFQMTKREFYEHFPNVVTSISYQVGRHYHSKAVPVKAMRFKLP